MINSSFAQNFVNKVNRQLQHNVNIMNEKRIIIASSAPERIGDFHIIAYGCGVGNRRHDVNRDGREKMVVPKYSVGIKFCTDGVPGSMVMVTVAATARIAAGNSFWGISAALMSAIG